MKIFTIKSGKKEEGVEVEKYAFAEEMSIPTITIGEKGRGRKLGILPVQLSHSSYEEWKKNGKVKIKFADLGSTRSGRPKLIESENANSSERIICIFRTEIGFRGGNDHSGDLISEEVIDGKRKVKFAPFPGEVLVEGQIAQGSAGRMGSGDQLIAVMPKDIVFRTGYSGRLYGKPSSHYYKWTGEQLLVATWEEREISDIF